MADLKAKYYARVTLLMLVDAIKTWVKHQDKG